MKLNSNIFWLVFVATVLPLLVLVMGATSWSERQYQKNVDREVTASLSSLVSEIRRLQYFERELILALRSTDNIKAYLPVLQQAQGGNIHPEFFRRSEKLKQFLAGMQSVVPGFSAIRVLDHNANTLILVRFGHGYLGDFDGIESFPYAEDEVEDEASSKMLRSLSGKGLHFVLLPQNRPDKKRRQRQKLLSAVVPLVYQGKRVGYLAVDFSGTQIDHMLQLVTRVHKGQLLIAEINPENKARDGYVLFDDVQQSSFAKQESAPIYLRVLEGGLLWEAIQNKPYGMLKTDSGLSRTYYVEYQPYTNSLASWVIASRINLAEINRPFYRIRLGIIVFAVVAIVLSLILARFGAKRIVGPVRELARGMKRYAAGDRTIRVSARGADEMQQLEQSFNEMADTLDHAQLERDKARDMMLQSAKLASIGQMASGIGHEINNPLNNILSYTKLMKRSVEQGRFDKLDTDIESLRTEALRASGIIRGVLNFARQVPPEYSSFPVCEWLDETVALARQAAVSKRVDLNTACDVRPSLSGDYNQLQQVLVNLILNAIFASEEEGVVEIRASSDGKSVRVDVIDAGCGIAPETLDRIFDPFFSTKPVGDGSGLGLSISLGIVERHHGSLAINNNPGKGVTATIVLPLKHKD